MRKSPAKEEKEMEQKVQEPITSRKVSGGLCFETRETGTCFNVSELLICSSVWPK